LFYEDDVPRPTSLQSEVNSWQRKWSSVPEDDRPDSFVEAVKQADGDFYLNIRKLMMGIRCLYGVARQKDHFPFFGGLKLT